jgi:Gpi18-like mannosyltransferase
MAKYLPQKIIPLLIIGLFLRLLLMSLVTWHPDLNNHIDWGIRFLALGPEKFYENIFWGVSWPNQPLGTMLLFAICAYLKQIFFTSIEFINQNIPIFPSFIIPYLEQNLHAWMVKLPFILSDIGLAYLIFKVVNHLKPRYAIIASSLFLFNPAVIYNSTIWGQTDSLINLLALSGLLLIFNRKYFFGIILFLSSFLFKLSLIIYLPIFAILLFKQIKDWRKFIFPLLSFFVFIYFLATPFAFGDKTPFDWLWYLYENRVLVRQGSMLNGNAFNFWFLLFGVDFSRSEFTTFGPITYQLWSRIILALFLLPICLKFFKAKLNLNSLLAATLLTAFGSFIFLTNMHERYLYPIFPIATILVFLKPNFISLTTYFSLSFIHLINMYNLWFYPQLPFVENLLISQNFILGRIFSLVLIFYCFRLLLDYLKRD